MKQIQKVIKQLNAILDLLAAEPQDSQAIKDALLKTQIELLKASNSIIGGADDGTRGGAS